MLVVYVLFVFYVQNPDELSWFLIIIYLTFGTSSVVWHLLLPLMNNVNKTETAVSHSGYASWGFPFSQFNSELFWSAIHEFMCGLKNESVSYTLWRFAKESVLCVLCCCADNLHFVNVSLAYICILFFVIVFQVIIYFV